MDAERGSSPPAADATAAGGETEATASWQGSTISSFCIWTEPVRDGCFGIHQTPDGFRHDLRLPAGAASATFTFTWQAADLRTERLVAVVESEGGMVQEREGASPLVLELDEPPSGTLSVYLYVPRLAGLPVQGHDFQAYGAEARYALQGPTP